MIKVIVVGAGFGGLSVSALLQKKGISTTLLEAHSVVGGCASFFKRKTFVFDVGATTLSGVLPHQSVGKLFRELEIQPKLLKLDPSMIIVQNQKEIIRKTNLEEWILECEEKFGKMGQRQFWEKINKINESAWQFLSNNENFSNSSIWDFLKLVSFKNLPSFFLLKTTFQNVKSLLDSYKISSFEFKKFLQEQLLITTQSSLEQAPLLTAAMGLSYPNETYYPYGGMYKIAEEILNSFLKNGGEFYKNTKVVSIEKKDSGYEVRTKDKKKFFADVVICNLPIWNIPQITGGEISKYFQNLSSKYPHAPAAFVINFGVNLKGNLPTCYYQIHSRKPIPYCNADAFFVSFSHFEDREKAPFHQAAVTISVHTNSEDWYNLSETEYKERKQKVAEIIINEFDSYFQDKLDPQKYYLTTASPKTFEEYTHRFRGYVGGIPHTIKPHFFQMPSFLTPFRGFYVVGDTIFPGQGTPAVVYSALVLAKKIIKLHVK